MIYLSEALENNYILKNINLNSNYIGENEKNLKFLTEGLMKNQSLHTVNLKRNCLKSFQDNFKYLEILKKNKLDLDIKND